MKMDSNGPLILKITSRVKKRKKYLAFKIFGEDDYDEIVFFMKKSKFYELYFDFFLNNVSYEAVISRDILIEMLNTKRIAFNKKNKTILFEGIIISCVIYDLGITNSKNIKHNVMLVFSDKTWDLFIAIVDSSIKDNAIALSSDDIIKKS